MDYCYLSLGWSLSHNVAFVSCSLSRYLVQGTSEVIVSLRYTQGAWLPNGFSSDCCRNSLVWDGDLERKSGGCCDSNQPVVRDLRRLQPDLLRPTATEFCGYATQSAAPWPVTRPCSSKIGPVAYSVVQVAAIAVSQLRGICVDRDCVNSFLWPNLQLRDTNNSIVTTPWGTTIDQWPILMGEWLRQWQLTVGTVTTTPRCQRWLFFFFDGNNKYSDHTFGDSNQASGDSSKTIAGICSSICSSCRRNMHFD